MKASSFILIVNGTTIVALAFFVSRGTITLPQLPLVALISLAILNVAAIVGLRLRGRRLK